MACTITFNAGKSLVIIENALEKEQVNIKNIALLLTGKDNETKELISIVLNTIINKNRSLDSLVSGEEARTVGNYTLKEVREQFPEIFTAKEDYSYNPEILLVNYLTVRGKKYEGMVYAKDKYSKAFVLSTVQDMHKFNNFLLLRNTIINKFNSKEFAGKIEEELKDFIPENYKDSWGKPFSNYMEVLLDFLENENYYSKYTNGLFATLYKICNELLDKKNRFNTKAELELYIRRNDLTPTKFILWASTYFSEACNEEVNIALQEAHKLLGNNFKAENKVKPIWEYISNILRNDPLYTLNFILESVNSKSILFKDNTASVDNLFGYTFNTIHDNISYLEHYRDYNIYKDSITGSYIVSAYNITPETFVVKYNTAEEAKEAIDTKYSDPKARIKFDANYYKNSSEILDSFFVENYVPINSVVTKLDVTLTKGIDKDSRLYSILIGNLDTFYDWANEEFSNNITDIKSKITSNEKAGLFLHLFNEGKKVNEILSILDNAPLKHYLVTGTHKISSRGESGYMIETIPVSELNPVYDETYTRPLPIILELETTVSFLNKKGVKAHILTSNEITEQFPDIKEHVKAFIYNGEVYINGDVATSKDPLHEYAHLLLGILKALNFEVYEDLLQKAMNLAKAKNKLQRLERSYPDRAKTDIYEEVFADLFGEFINGENDYSILESVLLAVTTSSYSIFDLGSVAELSEVYSKNNISAKTFFTKFCSEVASAENALNFNLGIIYRQVANKIELGIKDKKIIENCK